MGPFKHQWSFGFFRGMRGMPGMPKDRKTTSPYPSFWGQMDVSTLFKSSNIAKPSLKILEIGDGLAMSDDLAEQTMHDAFYLAQKLPMMMFLLKHK